MTGLDDLHRQHDEAVRLVGLLAAFLQGYGVRAR
jgi:hypothetical protein